MKIARIVLDCVLLNVLFFASCTEDETDQTPGLFEITVSDTTSTSATISWTAAADPQGDPLTYSIYLEISFITDTVLSRTFTFSDLLPETSYTRQITASDPNGNQRTVEFSFTTKTLEIPGQNFILPKKVSMKVKLFDMLHPSRYHDSVYYYYSHENNRIKSIQRITKNFDCYPLPCKIVGDVNTENFTLKYLDKELHLEYYDVNNTLVEKKSIFYFTNDQYIYPFKFVYNNLITSASATLNFTYTNNNYLTKIYDGRFFMGCWLENRQRY